MSWRSLDSLIFMNSSKKFRLAILYLLRALFLRCPTCGISPIFVPLKKTRSLRDWFTPLDGCPRCGYPYEREPGYFLMAIWAINYGLGSLLGIILYLFLEWRYNLPIWNLMAVVIIPVIFFNIFFARHSKALFLALDHFCDPHEPPPKDDDDTHSSEPLPPIIPQGDKAPTPSLQKEWEVENIR